MYTITMTNVREYEKILKVFANSRRLEIVRYLKEKKEASVGDIAKYIKLSFKATSKHLSILISVDLFEKEQRGLLVFYRLSKVHTPLAKSIVAVL